ncbi:hypothetical protein BDQ17DRAFT_1546102 [Cyathus striatus]|nr:hypothetical protein BDQ17DRAFT_1546102 [Cyathus striatus]
MMQRAFIVDPIQNYFARLDKLVTSNLQNSTHCRNLERFFSFMVNLCWMSGARITVVVSPQVDPQKSSSEERIVSCCIWRLPKQPTKDDILTLVRAGLLPVFWGWGPRSGQREGTADDHWYLQLAGTEPEYQGQGMLSLLMREAFAHAPSSIFTLEASTTTSKDKYSHFGFVLVEEVTIAKGEVSADGIICKPNGTGFVIYPMIKHHTSNYE